MKILHFILGKANKNRANGVNQVIAGLAKYTSRMGTEVRVIGKAETVSREGEVIVRDGFTVEAYSGWNQPLRAALLDAIEWADIIHLHGVYSPWNLLVARMCIKRNCPYIITLHDGLAPERAQARGKLKKRIFDVSFQRRYLEDASGIHVLTNEESTDLLAVSRPKYIFCIPNGVDLDDYPSFSSSTIPPIYEGRIGYLGRLSSEKNLDALCAAFTKVNTAGNLRLELAGPQSAYGDSLLRRFANQGVIGVGARFGQEKSEFIRSLDVFIHPSLCDVFSIAAMEVLALGTPLLITRTSKASYLYGSGAFFMCEPTAYGLEQGLQQIIDGRSGWRDMVTKGRRLIESKLNWQSTSRDMLAQYDYILQRCL